MAEALGQFPLTDSVPSLADATLTERGFSAWVLADDVNNPITGEWLEEWQRVSPSATSGEVTIVNNEIYIGGVSSSAGQDVSQDGLSLVFNGYGWADLGNALGISVGDTVATRSALPGYVLGSQADKPLASEAEAEALRQGKLDKTGGELTGRLSITGNNAAMAVGTATNAVMLYPAFLALVRPGDSPGSPYVMYRLTLPETSGILALSDAIAPNYSPDATYAAGDQVTYQGKCYTANQAISTAEAWDPEHWDQTDVKAMTALTPYFPANWFITVDVTPTTSMTLVLGPNGWVPYYNGEPVGTPKGNETSTYLTWNADELTIPAAPLYASRGKSYQLGTQTDRLVVPADLLSDVTMPAAPSSPEIAQTLAAILTRLGGTVT